MSPGNLYRYFPSKEAIIAGIAERDRAEVGASFAQRATVARISSPTFAALARHHLVERTDDEVGLCAEIMVGEPAQSGDRRASCRSSTRTCTRGWSAMLRAAAERGDIRADVDIDGVVDDADGDRRRRLVAPRASIRNSTPEAVLADVHGYHALHAARPRQRADGTRRPVMKMKASRIAAVGLVAAAASGCVRPSVSARDRGEPRRHPRASEAAEKLFRVAVIETKTEPHSRKLIAVGPHRSRPQGDDGGAHRRRADRTAGAARPARARRARSSPSCPTRRARRRSRRRARWSPSARPNSRQAPQADRERHHAEARTRQSRIAVQGRGSRACRPRKPNATAASCARHGTASSPSAGRSRRRGVLHWPARRSRRSSRSIRCWRSSKSSERKLAGIKVGDDGRSAPRHRAEGDRPRPLRLEIRGADDPHLSRRGGNPECRRRDSGRHHRRSRDSAWRRMTATRVPRSALTFSSSGRPRRARGRRERHGAIRAGQRDRGRPDPHVGRAASPTARASSCRARISCARARRSSRCRPRAGNKVSAAPSDTRSCRNSSTTPSATRG